MGFFYGKNIVSILQMTNQFFDSNDDVIVY